MSLKLKKIINIEMKIIIMKHKKKYHEHAVHCLLCKLKNFHLVEMHRISSKYLR